MKSIIVKLEQATKQTHGGIVRVSGLAQGKYLYDLISNTDLKANPRASKDGAVVDAIRDSISQSENLHPFKTKGILLASARYRELDRGRFELTFEHEDLEGILDGGHNMLATTLEILSRAVKDEKVINRLSLWSEVHDAWRKYQDAVMDIRDEQTFLVPVEILLPAQDDDDTIKEFREAIFEICEARNNNAQLSQETKDNKKGFYEALKNHIDPAIRSRIEWKTNDGGDIKARDIIALSLVPLSKIIDRLESEVKLTFTPNMIYNSKARCVELFSDIMQAKDVTQREAGYIHKLSSPLVESALRMMNRLPKLYDIIYTAFPEAYNYADGNFGRITGVRKYNPEKWEINKKDYMRKQYSTSYYGLQSNYDYPDGFIMPLVFGLSALMRVSDTEIIWVTDPEKFIANNLNEILNGYKLVIDMAKYDPQVIGKNSAAYSLAVSLFEKQLMAEGMKTAV